MIGDRSCTTTTKLTTSTTTATIVISAMVTTSTTRTADKAVTNACHVMRMHLQLSSFHDDLNTCICRATLVFSGQFVYPTESWVAYKLLLAAQSSLAFLLFMHGAIEHSHSLMPDCVQSKAWKTEAGSYARSMCINQVLATGQAASCRSCLTNMQC